MNSDAGQLRFSFGLNVKDANPTQHAASSMVSMGHMLDRNRAGRDKASASYICAPLAHGKRCAADVEPRRWVALDADRVDVDVLPEWRMRLAGFSGVGWATHSSTPDKPRERVILELDREITRPEGLLVGKALRARAAAEFGSHIALDKSTDAGEQCCLLAAEGVPLLTFQGDPLPVDQLLAEAALLPPERPDAPAPGGNGSGDGKVLSHRNDFLSGEAYRLRKHGQAIDQIEVVLQALNLAVCEPPLTAAEVHGIALRKAGIEPSPPSDRGQDGQTAAPSPSEDAVALMFVDRHPDHRYVATWCRWLRWDGQRWCDDSTGRVYGRIRTLVRELVKGGKAERSTANSMFVGGVEKLLRFDSRCAIEAKELDADPWALNTASGIVDLRTGVITPHDPARLFTRITSAAVDARQGAELWQQFLTGITQGDDQLARYLQRVAGYCATGITSEDVLVYLFGVGANGKGSFAEAVMHVLGGYAKMFPAEVLMESKGERHPTDLAQFLGVRFALTSEPSSNSTWNDSRIKSLTGDTTISARFMRGDFFTFDRSHKTVCLGNHMPRLAEVTHAIRRRVQMTPFRAVFEQVPGATGMRERLKAEAGGAILAWIVDGARAWLALGTAPPPAVLALTAEYLDEQDVVGQWLSEHYQRDGKSSENLADMHRDYVSWCESQGTRPKGNRGLSSALVSAGLLKVTTMAGKQFFGLRRRAI